MSLFCYQFPMRLEGMAKKPNVLTEQATRMTPLVLFTKLECNKIIRIESLYLIIFNTILILDDTDGATKYMPYNSQMLQNLHAHKLVSNNISYLNEF